MFVILFYITLDLSVASIPGAFVFDPGGSVESVRMSRAQEASEIIFIPAPAHDPNASLRELTKRRRLVPAPSMSPGLPRIRQGMRDATRGTDLSSTEDPH